MKNSPSNPENPLIRGLLTVSKAVTGVVALLLVGTLIAIYFLLLPTRPEGAVAPSAPTEEPVAQTTVSVATPVANVPDTLDGKDVASGLLVGEGLSVVKANCLGCHSAKLVTQNRFTRQGWHQKIVWMQQTQGLWDLGDNEPIILDYLAEHYAPEARAARRQPLTNIEWYELKDQ